MDIQVTLTHVLFRLHGGRSEDFATVSRYFRQRLDILSDYSCVVRHSEDLDSPLDDHVILSIRLRQPWSNESYAAEAASLTFRTLRGDYQSALLPPHYTLSLNSNAEPTVTRVGRDSEDGMNGHELTYVDESARILESIKGALRSTVIDSMPRP